MSESDLPLIPPSQSKADNCMPLPDDACLICTFSRQIPFGTLEEEYWLVRTPERDEIWTRSPISDGVAAYGPRKEPLSASAFGLLNFLVRTRLKYGAPEDFLRPGLITEQRFEEMMDAVFDDQAERQRAAGYTVSPILELARRLRLSPDLNGPNDSWWFARCPGSDHELWILPDENRFECEHCDVRGGPERLRRLADERREQRRK